MEFREYSEFDATALAELVRTGQVSAAELLEAAIARNEAVNGTLNAVIHRMYERARHAAQTPVLDAPFAGVPFLMKDFCAEIAGEPFLEGSAFLRNYVSTEDSELYRRFCRAGLVTFGKTNLPEFAVGATTEPRHFGPSRNPWDITRTTGGSSGGAAAAVAARVVPMAHGNDVGGSIRIPAACCGLVGLKPSRGRGTVGPHYGDILAGFFVEHALTRTVRDCATLLDATAGPMTGDPYHAPPPERPFGDEVGRDPGRLRIAFSDRTPFGEPIHPDCAAAARATARVLEGLGHDVAEAAPDFDPQAMWHGFTTLISCCAAWVMADWARRTDQTPTEGDFEPFIWAFAERGRALGGADYLMAMQDVQHQVRALSRMFDDYDLFLTATLGQPPVALGTLVYDGDPFELRRRTAEFSPYTYLSNATGQPALSLPLHWNAAGLPIGIQLVGRYADESTLFRIAAALETACPWHERRPADPTPA